MIIRLISSVPFLAGLILILTSVNGQANDTGFHRGMADTIYKNGIILTLNLKNDVAEAVAVKGDKTLAVGSDLYIDSLKGGLTRVVDLQGNTLIPGFYDAHSHIVATGIVGLYQVNLNSPPIGSIRTIDDLVTSLQRKTQETPAGEWVQGFGYLS